MGLLTIRGEDLAETRLGIPNNVIRKLYFDYFGQLIREYIDQPVDPLNIQASIRDRKPNSNKNT